MALACLNRGRHDRATRLGLALTISAMIFIYGNLAGKPVGIHQALYPMVALSLMLFEPEEMLCIFLSAVFPVVAYLGLWFFDFSLLAVFRPDRPIPAYYDFLAGLAVTAISFSIVHYFYRSNRKADTELRASYARMQLLTNSMPTLVSYVNTSFHFEFCNPTYEKWFGLPPSAVVGHHMQDVIGKQVFEGVQPKLEQALAGETIQFERHLDYLYGGARTVQVTCVPDFGPNGKVNGFVALVQDVTQARENEALLEQQRSTSIVASKMSALGEMSGAIAHEINNPLAIIHGKAGQLKDLAHRSSVDPAVIALYAATIESTALRISRIVRSLRWFAREGDKDPFESITVETVFKETSELCLARFKSHGIQLKIDPGPSAITFDCRSVQIAQVLLNLLNNAHDAVENLPDPWVTLEAREVGNRVEISVIDSGSGIPVELREKILLPFFTTKEIGKGTGLGLSVSKSIIETHRGALFLDTGSAHTRFVMNLPKTQAGRYEVKSLYRGVTESG